MPFSPRLRARLFGLEKPLPRHCPVCAGRDRQSGVLFRFNGDLLTAQGERVNELALEPCTSCGHGRDEWLKIVVGVDPTAI